MFVRLLSFHHCWFYPTVSLSFDDPRVCLAPSCFQLLTVFRVVTLPSINLFHFCFFRINISSFYLIYFPSFYFMFVLPLLLYLAYLPFLFCFDRNLDFQSTAEVLPASVSPRKLLKARFLCSEVVNADTLTLFRRRVPKSCCLPLLLFPRLLPLSWFNVLQIEYPETASVQHVASVCGQVACRTANRSTTIYGAMRLRW